jgi:hypothetical protein
VRVRVRVRVKVRVRVRVRAMVRVRVRVRVRLRLRLRLRLLGFGFGFERRERAAARDGDDVIARRREVHQLRAVEPAVVRRPAAGDVREDDAVVVGERRLRGARAVHLLY